MARLSDPLREMLTHPTTRPEPKTLRASVCVDRYLADAFNRGRIDAHQIAERVRRELVHRIAGELVIHCAVFEVPTYLNPDHVFSLEVTLNDRGSYENMLPVARDRGRQEGFKAARAEAEASLPYGMADARFEC